MVSLNISLRWAYRLLSAVSAKMQSNTPRQTVDPLRWCGSVSSTAETGSLRTLMAADRRQIRRSRSAWGSESHSMTVPSSWRLTSGSRSYAACAALSSIVMCHPFKEPIIASGQRPFEGYIDQPDTAERVRRAVQAIPFALPPKKEEPDGIDTVR